jgi:nucleoside-diphosphate-sugar epimerase
VQGAVERSLEACQIGLAMADTNKRTVTVFGGTGFLGRHVVRHLRKHDFSVRIASRHPGQGYKLFVLMIRNFNRSRPTFIGLG